MAYLIDADTGGATAKDTRTLTKRAREFDTAAWAHHRHIYQATLNKVYGGERHVDTTVLDETGPTAHLDQYLRHLAGCEPHSLTTEVRKAASAAYAAALVAGGTPAGEATVLGKAAVLGRGRYDPDRVLLAIKGARSGSAALRGSCERELDAMGIRETDIARLWPELDEPRPATPEPRYFGTAH